MGTKAEVKNNGGSSTRVRANGSSELMDGNTVAIQFEYEESGSGVNLRHANAQFGGQFGRITIGQGSEAGDGSAYSDTTGVFGIGHGAGTGAGFSLSPFFGSLDAGGRTNMVRYDTPAIGPMSAAVSVGNNDSFSGMLSLSTEFSGTSFGAKAATLQKPDDRSTLGASFGATLASGLTVSGAWAKADSMSAADEVFDALGNLLGVDPDEVKMVVEEFVGVSFDELLPETDPSYFQAEIGYKFGNTGIAASWYSSEDFVVEGSEGTAIGIGARHTLPKVGAEIYAAVQNYDITPWPDAKSVDETVFVVGTRVKF